MSITRSMLRLALPVCALAALTNGSVTHAQGLLGQDVHVNYLYPTVGNLYENEGTQTVTAGGVSYDSFGEITTTVLPNQVVETFETTASFTPASFNGVEISEVGISPVPITSVTLDGATNLPGFSASDVTFDASDIFINYPPVVFTPGNNVTLDINTSANTPEPGALALFSGLGVSGVAFLRRKRSR